MTLDKYWCSLWSDIFDIIRQREYAWIYPPCLLGGLKLYAKRPYTITNDWAQEARINIIVGHYGCGKTEFAVNLALALSESGKKTALADLDVVSPYFRSRDQAALLLHSGIKLIASSQRCSDADVPAMPVELNSLIQDKTFTGILDIGGDAVGARVLARLKPQLSVQSCNVLFVLNANRPLVSTPEKAIQYLRHIECTIGMPITGIVNNTHLCRYTAVADIKKGADLAIQVSLITGIKFVCHVVESSMLSQCEELPSPIFPIVLHMKKPWEMESIHCGKEVRI